MYNFALELRTLIGTHYLTFRIRVLILHVIVLWCVKIELTRTSYSLFMKRSLLVVLTILGLTCSLRAQNVAVKTNLLYDAAATVNLGAEVLLAPKWSLDVSGNLNAWRVNDHSWKHWLLQPEARYWFCDHFTGHFVGAHLLGGQYNLGNISGLPDFLGTDFSLLKDTRVQGWFVGAGVAYGYSWILGKHWNIEAEIGFGWAYSRFDRFPACVECGSKIESDKPHHYVGPTKAAVNLVYVF